MPIRKATEDDQVEMAKVAAAAFFDEEMFGDLIHPHRQQYPEDTYLFWLKRIQKAWDFPFNTFLVVTAHRTAGEGGEAVAAWAQWMRKGAVSKVYEAEIAQNGPLPSGNLPVNRAASVEYEDVLERSYPFFVHEWSGPRAEAFDLAWLATSPNHQGKGFGKLLVQWGIEQAEQEGVPLSVIAAYGKDGFYNKLGFVTPSGKASDGDGNPMPKSIKGGQFWWCEGHLTAEQ